MAADELTTRQVAEGWFGNAAKGDFGAALALVDPDVEWDNIPPVRGVTDLAPWLGSYKGLPAVLESFKVWGGKSEMKGFELLELTVEGERAVGIVHEHARCLANGNEYDLYVATCLVVRGGKIVKWQVYWDPSPLVAAYRDIR